MFEGVASVNPRLLTVPLLPWAGWSAGKDSRGLCAGPDKTVRLHTVPLLPCGGVSTGESPEVIDGVGYATGDGDTLAW